MEMLLIRCGSIAATSWSDNNRVKFPADGVALGIGAIGGQNDSAAERATTEIRWTPEGKRCSVVDADTGARESAPVRLIHDTETFMRINQRVRQGEVWMVDIYNRSAAAVVPVVVVYFEAK